jgi:UDP-glucose 4-epimerase
MEPTAVRDEIRPQGPLWRLVRQRSDTVLAIPERALYMQDKRVLVTGGAGFIGSNLANHLAEDNDVTAVDDLYLGTPDNLRDDVEFVQASVLDDDLPSDVDVLFHLAALSSRNMHEENPQLGARVNVEGFVNTVEQVRKDGCETVVYATTSSIYGSRTEPSPEDMEIEAHTGYEASKLARERYGEYYANHYDMNVAGLRFFSVYQGFGGNEAHKGEYANTIAQFADKIAGGESPELFGDGTQTRDFTHVDDVVRACEQVADEELTGVYNVGTGVAYSFNEMVEMINEELGTDVDPAYIETPFDDYVHDTLADASKLQEATGWEPEIDFREGVARVCEPYK